MEKAFGIYLHIVLLSFILIPYSNLSAQDSEGVDNQVWFDYEAFRIPRETIQFMGDAGYRYLVGGGWEKYLIRPSLQKSINKWLELFGGVGFFYTVQTGLSNTLEIRPWVGAKISYRIRFEGDRFFMSQVAADGKDEKFGVFEEWKRVDKL